MPLPLVIDTDKQLLRTNRACLHTLIVFFFLYSSSQEIDIISSDFQPSAKK